MELVKEKLTGTEFLKSSIGNTPLFRLRNIYPSQTVSIYAKLEWMQIGGSIKARPAFNIIRQALQDGLLGNGKVLLDASSGNTAIAYAAIGAMLKIPVTICLPENASAERQAMLRAFGAQLIYTSKFGGTDEAQLKAKEIYKQDPHRFYYADQYNNPHNWRAHYKTTAEEIYRQTAGKLTHLAVGLGTSGTAMGTTRKLKELKPSIKVTTLQPRYALHNLEGWKHMETAIQPSIYDPHLADDNLDIDGEEALVLIKQVAEQEGLLLSPSAAGNLLGAIKIADELSEGMVVTVFPDSAEKYSEVMRTVL